MLPSRSLFVPVLVLGLTACVTEAPIQTTEPEPEPEAITHRVISGSVTWDWDFDEQLEQDLGWTDCSYTRHYQGIEDSSEPWLCPQCEEMWRLEVTLEPGGEDCLYQVSYLTTPLPEWIGLAADGSVYRGPVGYGMNPLMDSFTIEGDTATWSASVTTPFTSSGSGEVLGEALRITEGTFQLSEAEGDPLHELLPPESYSCGWPSANPAPYTGDFVLERGATLPDGVFRDQCDEPVRLHDFAGGYILLAAGAPDCAPCVDAAAGLSGLEEELAAEGVTLSIIELMTASLAAPLDTPSLEVLQSWAATHELEGPVLADRGWGWYTGQSAGLAEIPLFIVVDPELRVIDWTTGYGGGTRARISGLVLEDAAR